MNSSLKRRWLRPAWLLTGALGAAAVLLAPAGALAIQNQEPSDDFFPTVEELDSSALPPGIEQTPVLHLVLSDGRLQFEQSPWQSVANPFNTDPGEASYRNEPNYEPGVVILNF